MMFQHLGEELNSLTNRMPGNGSQSDCSILPCTFTPVLESAVGRTQSSKQSARPRDAILDIMNCKL